MTGDDGAVDDPDAVVDERRSPIAAVLVGAVVLLVPVGALLALAVTRSSFADSSEAGRVRAVAATVDLAAGQIDSELGFEDLVPGETVHLGIAVRNEGDLPLRYTLVVLSGDGALAEALDAELRVTASGCTPEAFDDGVPLSSPGRLGGPQALRLFGDPLTGSQHGDRFLRVGQRETLCFRVSVPIDLGNSLQGRSTVQTYVFDAEQAT